MTTPRLVLRAWTPADREPFAAMNADPRVMEHFPSALTADESDALVDRIVAGWSAGYGLWAVESPESGAFLGFVGLSSPGWSASFTPCVEVGWRLVPRVWGQGLATEGARAAIRWAGANVSPPRGELVSFTTTANVASRRVMEKLGLRHDPAEDFDHPLLPDWSGRRHVLYRAPLQDLVELADAG